MPMNKHSFQPKNARAVSIYHQDDMDDEMDELSSQGSGNHKKAMTGTQALVEFLKTTSPEEFQRTTNTSSTSHKLFRLMKPKRSTSNLQQSSPPIPTPSLSARSVPSSTNSVPVTLHSSSTLTAPTSYHGSDIIHRKNYIEIVPQNMISKSAGNSRSPSFETTTPSIQSFVLRNNNNNNNNKGEPILPNKKRESSLYSGSLRHSVSVKSHLSNQLHRNSNRISTKMDESRANEDYLAKSDGMDMIESALLQRLERFKLLDHELPSDQVATGLAAEHVRALGITHTLDNIVQQQETKTNKIRHMQIQTEACPYYPPQLQVEPTVVPPTNKQYTDQDFEKRAARAEAALENALDHFEVISGLAYKKLREIWEEKVRWENACMELRNRLVVLEQKKYPFQQGQQQQQQNGVGFHPGRDYFLEETEEEDELGLSEFPCSQ